VQVQAQGEMAERIDANIDDTLSNVEGAQAALLKYYESISGNKWLILKVFAVLLVFIFIFVVFLA
jgi:syntaxin 5